MALDFWFCSNPANGMREGAQGVFVNLLFGIFVSMLVVLPSYLHLWHNELFDRAMIFVATYLDFLLGPCPSMGF